MLEVVADFQCVRMNYQLSLAAIDATNVENASNKDKKEIFAHAIAVVLRASTS